MEIIRIKEVMDHLENLAPRSLQEDYDNCGLLTGSPDMSVTGILVTLDCIEGVVDEAIQQKCNLIIAHHPIIFKGLKSLTGKNYVERTIIKAIKNNIAIYAIHTNLDNVQQGVNQMICQKLGLENLRILAPRKGTLTKLVTFIPKENSEPVIQALHEAGAGHIGNYKDCSFRIAGTGTFRPVGDAKPHLGETGKLENVEEVRVELVFPSHLESKVMNALRSSHPYEEVAYYLTQLNNENQEVGSGMVGDLKEPEEPMAFLKRLKSVMNTPCVRHTAILPQRVKKVAVCGGAGSFLLPRAIAAGAHVYISADFKYHEFFDANGKVIIADIGHFESEQYTKDLLVGVLKEKFPTFAINFSKTATNPLSYL